MADYVLPYTGEQVESLLGQISQAQPITYGELKTLRNGGNLIPGHFYRITDFVTTTAHPESRSVGNQFDVVVMATDNAHLSEVSYAAHHTGDSYFANSKLEAWKLWYSLDNDTTRFDWADTTNGKGVIYRMIDEHNNDLPYDFKNIQFKRYAVTAESQYTASLGQLDGLRIGQTAACYGFTIDTSSYYWYYTFSLMGNSWGSCTDGSLTRMAFNVESKMNENNLSNIVFANGPIVSTTLDNLSIRKTGYEDTIAFDMTLGRVENCTFIGHYEFNIFEDFVRNLFFGVFTNNHIYESSSQNTVVGYHTINLYRLSRSVIYVPSFSNRNAIDFAEYSYIYIGGGNAFQSNAAIDLLRTTIVTTNNVMNNDFGYMRDNVITGGVNYCKFRYYAHDNTISANINGVDFSGTQLVGVNISAVLVAVQFFGPVEYIDILENSNYPYFGFCTIKTLRGTSSARIKLGNENFYLPSASGIKRHVVIEGNGDNEIIATWKGTHGATVGVYATQAESLTDTWHNI